MTCDEKSGNQTFGGNKRKPNEEDNGVVKKVARVEEEDGHLVFDVSFFL